MVDVDENRVAQIERGARYVSEPEWRIRLGEAEFPDARQSADGVRVGDAREAEICFELRPPPGTREALACASDLVIGARQLVSDGRIEFDAAQAVRWVPRYRQQKSRVANDGRIDDDVLAEAALVALLLFDASRKDPSE